MSSNQQPSSAPFAQPSAMERVTDHIPSAQSMKESASSGIDAARQKVLNTQQVSEQLPTVEDTTATLKQGASSVIESIKSLAIGASNTTPPKVTTDKPADPDDLHIPGGFDDEPITSQLREISTVSDQSSIGASQSPAHAGTAANIPRRTVESSAQPDVSYEHRPKTLAQTEILGREAERGLRDADAGAPERVSASRRGVHWAPEATGSAEAVHEKSKVEKELLSKVQETPTDAETIAIGKTAPASGDGTQVVGNWRSEAAGVTGAAVSGTSGVTQRPAESSGYDFNKGSYLSGSGPQPNSTIQPAAAVQRHGALGGDVDLTSGVHNGVIGAGHDAKLQRRTSPGDVDLTAGVQNGIIGPGHDSHISGGPLALPKYEHDFSETVRNSENATGQSIHVDVKPAEFGGGVNNTVVGAGSRSGV